MSNLHLLVTPYQGQHEEAFRQIRQLVQGIVPLEVAAPHSIDVPLGDMDPRAAESLAEKVRNVSVVARAIVRCGTEADLNRRRTNIHRWED